MSEVCKQPDSTSLQTSVHGRRHSHSHGAGLKTWRADRYRQTCRQYMDYSGLFAAVTESLEGRSHWRSLNRCRSQSCCAAGVSRYSHCCIWIYMEHVSTKCLHLHWKVILLMYQNIYINTVYTVCVYVCSIPFFLINEYFYSARTHSFDQKWR